jgi:hypothetical protein
MEALFAEGRDHEDVRAALAKVDWRAVDADG